MAFVPRKDYMEDKSTKDQKTIKDSTADSDQNAFAKSGKRSAKSVAEAEVKASKVAKKEDRQETVDTSLKVIHKTRSKLERRSKNYRNASKLIDRDKFYTLQDAIRLLI